MLTLNLFKNALMKHHFSFLLLACFLPLSACGGEKILELKPYATFKFKEINESSGFVQSRQWPDVFWTHNDSGDAPRIFGVFKGGTSTIPKWMKKKDYNGVEIRGAEHLDWEDIAIDGKGNLYIGAFGNNGNTRQDLGVYMMREPNPHQVPASRTLKLIPFRYSDQEAFPPKKRNFDCEAFFHADETLYFLTKHRSDKNTKLYRLNSWETEEINELEKLVEFPIQGMVTGADISPDGKKLLVLTYSHLWLFERKMGNAPENKGGWFSKDAKISRAKLENQKQCEGVCFFDGKILISNEKHNELFEVNPKDLKKVQ